MVETPPAYQPSPPIRTGAKWVPPRPKLFEVQEAVKRVFKDAAVSIDNYNPNFFSGRLQRRCSQDIAVIIKPVKLDLNEPGVSALARQRATHRRSRSRALQIEKDETLLAVIHGYGTNDWRDPEATQTFVLKNVVGNDLKVHTGKEFVTANSGRSYRDRRAIDRETVQGTPGYLYYASATYSWYDPKTFKGTETRAGVFP